MNYSDCSFIDEVINLIQFGCMQQYEELYKAIEALSGEKVAILENNCIMCGSINMNLTKDQDLKIFQSKYCKKGKK